MQLLRDTMLIFRRHVGKRLRHPAWLVFGMLQPILYLSFFGPLVDKVSSAPGFPQGSGWQVYVPGLLVQLALFGTTFAGFGLIGEWRMGILERMRVTPVSRMALLLGRVLNDALAAVVQAAILVTVSVAFGLRAPILGVLIGLGFVLLLTVSVASFSYSAALMTKSEDAYAPLLSAISLPLLLLSGILLPLTLAPGWLDTLSRANPFRYIVDAMREAFLGNYTSTTILVGGGVAIVLAAGAVAVGTRTFRNENA